MGISAPVFSLHCFLKHAMAGCVSRLVLRSCTRATASASRLCLARELHAGRLCPAVFYTKKHEWIDVDDGKATGTVGITNYAQEALGDVVYAQLPEPDDPVEAGTDCGALESVKAASEVYSPCSGTVVEKNEKVEELPAMINSSAEDEGWLFKIKLTKPEELDALMDKPAYEAYLKSQEDDH